MWKGERRGKYLWCLIGVGKIYINSKVFKTEIEI
jgi:hypothetical protein